jgi:hypothetical protein
MAGMGCTVPISDRLVGDAGSDLLRRDAPELIGRHLGHTQAGLLELLAYVVQRDVFDLRDDHVVARPLVASGVAQEREIVRLGRPRGEQDLLRLGPDELRHLRPALLEDFGGAIADAVERGRVAEPLAEVGQHRFDNPRVDGLRRLIVEIDLACHLRFA